MRWSPLVVGILAILAGCQAPAGPAEPTATPSVAPTGPADRLAPDVPLSKNRTFERLTRVVNLTGDRPRIALTNLTFPGLTGVSAFQRTMGLDPIGSLGSGTPSGGTPNGRTVLFETANDSLVAHETVLVHEYVHALQFQHGLIEAADANALASTDRQYAIRGVIEGGAVWATTEYLARYRPEAARPGPGLSLVMARSSPRRALALAPYYFGYTYVNATVDDPRNFSRAYERYPNTTEQLLHPRSAGAEPPAPLELATPEGYKTVETDRKGELLVRMILRTELDRPTARRAAAGWGADRLAKILGYRRDYRYGFAWALRWDTPAEADEFVAAFDTYAERRDAANVTYRLERVAPETTVVLAGPDGFVRRARVNGTAASVRVRPAREAAG